MASGILVINAGSSSVKFALFVVAEVGGDLALRYRGKAEAIGDKPRLDIFDAEGARLLGESLPADADQEQALAGILDWLDAHLGEVRLIAAGHRVVHGGQEFSAPVALDQRILQTLERYSPLAPLHQPHNLRAISAVLALRPELPQVACFDTAFHRRQPRVAQLFALPREYADKGVLRYGFHGLSYEFIAQRLAELDPQAAAGRTVVAHLGNGASMCALKGGRSVATSMGFTALDGLMMGQRCGNLDPGVVLYLLQHEGHTAAEVEELLYRRSGLLGVSGVSADMRRVLASDSPAAQEAVELYCYRIVRELGSLVATLGGLDALVFTAGIGENSALVRERVTKELGWLGLQLDARANENGGPRISSDDSRVSAWALPTNEELMIARHTQAALLA